ncbi:MAG: hypothetical protein K8T91_02350 [Planctomycetes bacterium]|nr:hypothetical protein [Planctomycetota bacterium]
MWWILAICLSPALGLAGWLIYIVVSEAVRGDYRKVREKAEWIAEITNSLECPLCGHSLAGSGLQLSCSERVEQTPEALFDTLTVECENCGTKSSFEIFTTQLHFVPAYLGELESSCAELPKGISMIWSWLSQWLPFSRNPDASEWVYSMCSIVRDAFPELPSNDEYVALLSILGTRMSSRVVAEIVSTVFNRPYILILNELAGIGDPPEVIKEDPKAGEVFDRVRHKLVIHGFCETEQ